MFVAISQRERRVAVSLDVGLRRLRTKLIGPGGKLSSGLGGLLQTLFHLLQHPAVPVRKVGPGMGCHRESVVPTTTGSRVASA